MFTLIDVYQSITSLSIFGIYDRCYFRFLFYMTDIFVVS